MPKIDNEKFYSSAIKMYGESARGVNWASVQNQRVRFKEILAFLPKTLSEYTLADAGCGFADFYRYLEKKKSLPKEYLGLDIHDDMCAIAAKNSGQMIQSKDICKDALPTRDYYICSGALNVLTAFETQLFIRNCYHSSKIAFVFNALYAEDGRESQTYNYISKKEIEQIAKELDVCDVKYSEGYLENDITVVFYRDKIIPLYTT